MNDYTHRYIHLTIISSIHLFIHHSLIRMFLFKKKHIPNNSFMFNTCLQMIIISAAIIKLYITLDAVARLRAWYDVIKIIVAC